MKKQTLLAGIAAVAMLASCSKSDDQTIPSVSNDDIRAVAKALSIDVSSGAQSRAAYTDADAKNLQALVLTSQTKDDYKLNATIGTGFLYAKGTMKFDATDADKNAVSYEIAGFEGSRKLPADKSSLFLCALYPSTTWGSATTTASYTFVGTQDVMAAPQNEIKKGGTEKASFAFSHLLTKIDITVKAADADAITAWGDVKKIEISKVLNKASFSDKVTVTLASATAPTATAFSQTVSGVPTSWKAYKTDGNTEFVNQTMALTTTATAAATTIMAPFMATNAITDLELAVTTKTKLGSELITKVTVTVPAGNTQGKQYTINLNFKATDIKGSATVVAWGTTTPIDKDVE